MRGTLAAMAATGVCGAGDLLCQSNGVIETRTWRVSFLAKPEGRMLRVKNIKGADRQPQVIAAFLK
jgi:hypothetical protein